MMAASSMCHRGSPLLGRTMSAPRTHGRQTLPAHRDEESISRRKWPPRNSEAQVLIAVPRVRRVRTHPVSVLLREYYRENEPTVPGNEPRGFASPPTRPGDRLSGYSAGVGRHRPWRQPGVLPAAGADTSGVSATSVTRDRNELQRKAGLVEGADWHVPHARCTAPGGGNEFVGAPGSEESGDDPWPATARSPTATTSRRWATASCGRPPVLNRLQLGINDSSREQRR